MSHVHEHYYYGKKKSKGVAYALWFFLGIIGGHRFYLGEPIKGIIYFFTCAGLGIFWIIDLFTLSKNVDIYNLRFRTYHPSVSSNTNTNVNANQNTNQNTNTIVINNVLPTEQPSTPEIEQPLSAELEQPRS